MRHRKVKLIAVLLFGLGLTGLQAQTVKDIDGNVYKTITIGTQTWMAENLKTSKYKDGISIPLVMDSTAWSNLTTPGHCWYNNNKATNKKLYGGLYNWYTVNTGKLCPTGWHVPSETEWKTMITYLGGADAGDKLQETGTTHWLRPNTGATNESGYTALPGGCRILSGTFVTLGYCSYWWSSNGGNAGARFVGYYDSGIERGSYNKQFGLSVRCVRD